jgi:hypothetical protein
MQLLLERLHVLQRRGGRAGLGGGRLPDVARRIAAHAGEHPALTHRNLGSVCQSLSASVGLKGTAAWVPVRVSQRSSKRLNWISARLGPGGGRGSVDMSASSSNHGANVPSSLGRDTGPLLICALPRGHSELRQCQRRVRFHQIILPCRGAGATWMHGAADRALRPWVRQSTALPRSCLQSLRPGRHHHPLGGEGTPDQNVGSVASHGV